MAVNRFSTPVESEYISQYVPIPFEQLYALGKEYNTRLDKAYEQMASHIEKYKDFQSPSAIDTARWNQIMQTNVIDRVNTLMANPDNLKTQAGRAEIQNIINSMPYGEMNELKQSRDAMLQRQKLEQQLSLTGKYNPLWHRMDYTNYNTKNKGIFNDLNLLPYTSELDIVKPFVDNLKSEYIGTNGLYDVRGVSKERTAQQVDANRSAILNSPFSQKHIEILQKQGLTREQAEQEYMNRIYTAAGEFAYQDIEVNPLQLLREKIRLTNQNNNNPSLPVATPRQQLTLNAAASTKNNMFNQLSKLSDGADRLTAISAIEQQQEVLLEEINNLTQIQNPSENDKNDLKNLLNAYNELKLNENKLITNSIREDFKTKYGESIDFNNYNLDKIDNRNFGEASRQLIKSYSANIPSSQINRILEIQLGKPVKVNTLNGEQQGYVIDSNNTLLPQQLASGMLGIDNPLDGSPMSKKRGLLSHIALGAMTGMGVGATAAGATTLGIGTIPGAIGGSIIGAGTALLSNIFSEGGDDNVTQMWSDSKGFGQITIIPSQEVITVNTVNGDTEYVKAKAIIPKKRFSERDIDKSIINSRDGRMNNVFNADSNEDNDTYELDVYVPLSQNQALAKEYDRMSSNIWYGASTSDSDRLNEDLIEYERIGR